MERNEVLHMDYLSMGDSYADAKYLLVLKDELTHYCELVACDSPTSEVAVFAVLDWYKRFGLPPKWVSDQGSHFTSALMADLAVRLRGLQSFTPVYSPWINGTVERLNRDILQVTRALLLELRLDTRNWEYLLPIIQANLNQSPVASLGHKTPLVLFTGLPATTPLDTCFFPGHSSTLVKVDLSKVDEFLQKLRRSLHEMHMTVVDRKAPPPIPASSQEMHSMQFFYRRFRVVVSCGLTSRQIPLFIVRHLLTNAVHEVHGSRLKYYHDPSLEVTEELVEHTANQGIQLGVDSIRKYRYNSMTQKYELLISWTGLESIEDSWEPLSSMLADIPFKVREYAAQQDDLELRSLCTVTSDE
ncbi:Hypothetical protein PHPALM_16573 [Phytophthora palmivora]|uniref:Integrase catalytic domain-containing protein n=1 Tax=Phytophthora palmivora TaxID=4796 RepID=A0A2P4XPF9_9STRA|nr:Hypothetical protein PHPALM_16573 [Phytophthora palmivora]